MDADILQLVSRWIHMLAAIVLVGGTFFLRFTILPVSQANGLDENVQESFRKRWAKWVILSVLFLLISGLYNAAQKAIGYDLDRVYLGLLTIKILLALVIFFFVSALSGRSNLAKKFREAETKWYNVTCVAMLVLVCIAGYMKLSPQNVKVRTEEIDKTACRVLSDPDLTYFDQQCEVEAGAVEG